MAEKHPYEIGVYEDGQGLKPVLDWIRSDLSPYQRRALGRAMLRILQQGFPKAQWW